VTPEEAARHLVRAQRELGLRGSFYDFVRMAWPLVEPGHEFKDNWHIHLLCRKLEDVFHGRTRRLCVNIPPGCMKSLLVCVLWQVWCWIRDPSLRWIFASFDASLTHRDAGKSLQIIHSEWFRERWGDRVHVDPDAAVGDHTNTAAGFRFSTSVAGKMTGRHADILVVDDPIKPLEVTKKALAQVREWWTGTVPTRFRDLKTARQVIIMQRLHCDDLTGIVEEQGGWEILRLPMRYEPDAAHADDPRTTGGELLWSERFPAEEVQKLEEDMGSRTSAAQLQQRPVPEGGAIFRRDWFKAYEVSPGRFDQVVQSWDCTFKDTSDADFVCGQVWGRKGGEFYLLDMFHERASFGATLEAIRKMRRTWPRATTILVEDKANGSAVISTLKKEISGIVEVNPEGGKEARANAVSPFFEAGNVFHPNPETHPWVDVHRDELALFPAAKHDDTVDACSQALLYMHRKKNRYVEAMAKVRKAIDGAGFFARRL
jgi:predicted phage terminase large subunit-like protein